MATVSSEHILETLRQAREELDQDYQTRRDALSKAIDALSDNGTQQPAASASNGESKRNLDDLSIGSDKLKRVRQVLRTSTSGRLRQADIAKKAGSGRKPMNSGTVSVALRKLEQAGEIRSTGDKEDGSMVWEEIRTTAAAGTKQEAA